LEERYYLIFVGTAGSGKTTLVKAFGEWLESLNISNCKVNLDPAVEWIPYSPDVDVREYVDARRVAEEYQLGPNGALITSIDLLYNHVYEIRRDIIKSQSKYVLVDTPGQLELFAYRTASLEVIKRIANPYTTVVLFLIDGTFVSQASNLVSLLLLSQSVQLRHQLPQISLISKADILPREALDLVEKINESSEMLSELLQMEKSVHAIFIAKVLELIVEEGFRLIPVSAYNVDTLWPVFEEVQRILGTEEELAEQKQY